MTSDGLRSSDLQRPSALVNSPTTNGNILPLNKRPFFL